MRIQAIEYLLLTGIIKGLHEYISVNYFTKASFQKYNLQTFHSCVSMMSYDSEHSDGSRGKKIRYDAE